MGNVKISQLPAASTLAGDELLPAVQAGQNVGVSVAQIRTGLLNSTHAGSRGVAHATASPGGEAGFMSGADKGKLDGIQASATANSTDAQLRDRAAHTGTQAINTVSGLEPALDAKALKASPAFTGNALISSTDGTQVRLVSRTASSAAWPKVVIDNYSNGYGGYPVIELRQAKGIEATPASVATADILGGFNTWGYGTGMYHSATRVEGVAESAFSTEVSAALRVLTTKAGTQNERLRIESGGNGRPGADNTYSWGTASYRWKDIFAGTGTINTSDEREKEEVTPIDASLAEALLRAIDPVTFKWRDIDRPAVVESELVRRQRMTPQEVEIDEIVQAEDGRAVRVRHTVVEQRPVFEPHPVYGEDGVALLGADGEPMIHWEPVMEEVEEQITVQPAYHKVNVRTHWGFIAQQVERGLCEALGKVPGDPAQADEARLRFAGLVYDKETDRFGLREGQFIPILWAVVRDLVDRVAALQATRLPA
jgi:hypothetical protein